MRRFTATILLLVACTDVLFAQDIKIIRLKQQKIAYHLKNCHIISVIDDREDTTIIGTGRFGLQGKKMRVNLQDGLAGALNNFFQKNLTQENNTTPISLHIDKIAVSETETGALVQQTNVSLTVSFYQGDKKLIEYSGSGYQQARFDASMFIEKLIRDRIENCLKEFDNWWGENQAAINAKPSVKVMITLLHNTDDTDLIPYAKQRPLVLSDFQGTVEELNHAAAATFSGILVTYNSESQHNQSIVHVTLSPYFDKTKSWCRKSSRDARTLSHEQLHFDITAIKACILANAIRSYAFTENYAKELDQLRKQNEKDWQQLQNDYDKETVHGTNPAQQRLWEEKIKKQLADQACY